MTPEPADDARDEADRHLYETLVIFLLMEWARMAEREFGPDDASGRRWFGPADPGAHGGQHDLLAVLAPPWLVDGIVAYMLSHSEPNEWMEDRDASKAN